MKTIFVLLLCSMRFICLGTDNPTLTAVFNPDKNIVTIKWQHTNELVTHYILQRSSDDRTWYDVYNTDITNVKTNKIAKYTDPKPVQGKNYYRLKTIYRSGTDYSRSIMVIIGKPGNNWLMYPVPVKTILNLQYNGSDLIPGVITVYIQTMKGQILRRLRLASTTRLITIPVDNLGKGIYDIRIIIQNEIVWNQRFVK